MRPLTSRKVSEMPRTAYNRYIGDLRATYSNMKRKACHQVARGRRYTCVELWPDHKTAWCDGCKETISKLVTAISE